MPGIPSRTGSPGGPGGPVSEETTNQQSQDSEILFNENWCQKVAQDFFWENENENS